MGIYSINRSQIHECRNWERGRAVSFLGIFVSNFQYGVSLQCGIVPHSALCKDSGEMNEMLK